MTTNPSYKPNEGKREEFRRYLEKTGVMDALTKVLVLLYEEAEKPDDALTAKAFIGLYLLAKRAIPSTNVALLIPGGSDVNVFYNTGTEMRARLLTNWENLYFERFIQNALAKQTGKDTMDDMKAHIAELQDRLTQLEETNENLAKLAGASEAREGEEEQEQGQETEPATEDAPPPLTE